MLVISRAAVRQALSTRGIEFLRGRIVYDLEPFAVLSDFFEGFRPSSTAMVRSASNSSRDPCTTHNPAAVRFISAEPLLGPIELWPFLVTNASVCRSTAQRR